MSPTNPPPPELAATIAMRLMLAAITTKPERLRVNGEKIGRRLVITAQGDKTDQARLIGRSGGNINSATRLAAAMGTEAQPVVLILKEPPSVSHPAMQPDPASIGQVIEAVVAAVPALAGVQVEHTTKGGVCGIMLRRPAGTPAPSDQLIDDLATLTRAAAKASALTAFIEWEVIE